MKHSRQELMKQLFYKKKQITCQELCAQFDMSIETVRRDLAELEKMGIVHRIYGGAVLIDTNSYPDAISPWDYRSSSHTDEKQAIAEETIKWIPDNATVALDSGTTMMQIAKLLSRKKDLKVITNDIRVAMTLSESTDHEICLVGGIVKQSDLITLGHFSTDFLNSIAHIDITILTADGFDTKIGMYDHNYNMCNLKMSYIQHSQQVIAVMDSTKFNVKAPYRVCEAKDIDLLITDNSLSPQDATNFHAKGLRFITVETGKAK